MRRGGLKKRSHRAGGKKWYHVSGCLTLRQSSARSAAPPTRTPHAEAPQSWRESAGLLVPTMREDARKNPLRLPIRTKPVSGAFEFVDHAIGKAAQMPLKLQTAVVGALVGLTVAKTPTNFVVLFMDDNGWGDSGVNTNGAVKETPRSVPHPSPPPQALSLPAAGLAFPSARLSGAWASPRRSTSRRPAPTSPGILRGRHAIL